MELTYDWKSFQSFFYAKRRLAPSEVAPTGPIYLVVDERVIISAFSEGEDLSDWAGATHDEVAAEFPHRDLVLYDRERVDQWMGTAVGLTHFYEQIQHLRSEAEPPKGLIQKHFLLQSIQSWWQKIFPSTYGIYIRLLAPEATGYAPSLLLIVQRGRLNSFHVPDLSSMIPERRQHRSDVVKHLSAKYLVPVQGLFVSAVEWAEWSEMGNPWPKMGAALKADRNKLVPFQWSLAALVGIRAYFGL